MQNIRELFEEFKKDRGLCSSGFCPECGLHGKQNEMRLNSGDVFECPECHLMVSLASPGKATIIRRRGKGNFKSSHPHYGASRHIRNENLSRENMSGNYESDGTFIRDRAELESYLGEITGIDEFV